MHCPRCNSPYQEGDAFCKKCGLALAAPGTKTELATHTMTCPNCAATIPADATFCPKCDSTVSLKGATEPTVLVDRPVPSPLLRDADIVNTEAETVAATTTMSRIYPSCHARIQPGPEDRFCGNCGHMLV
ncbi:MAG TPA: zinc ribbon domain-containing protein [Ktedonobacteraceae bacterium]|nr:zinc ribbon domain-containing protein [Ktedonobacteraceae bacterium]